MDSIYDTQSQDEINILNCINETYQNTNYNIRKKSLMFVAKYGYIYPTKELIDILARLINNKKVLEIGSGYGIISHILKMRGIDIIATDIRPSTHMFVDNPKNFCDNDVWNVDFFKGEYVEKLTHHQAINKYHDREVLLMIWPLYRDLDVFKFKGKYIIMIGQKNKCKYGEGYLNKYFKEIKSIKIPKRSPFYDCDPYSYEDTGYEKIFVYERYF